MSNESAVSVQVNDSSLTTNIRAITSYVAKDSKAQDGEVLVIRRVKKPSTLGSKCVSMPRFKREEIMASVDAMFPAIEDMLHKARVAAFGKICDKHSHIDISSLTLQVAMQELESGRLNSEIVAEWFSEVLANELMDAFIAKGVTDEKKIEKSVEGYLELLKGLVSGRTQYTKHQRDGLRKALELVNEEDSIKVRFLARLNGMESKEEELLELL
jgi:hypothetical protein